MHKPIVTLIVDQAAIRNFNGVPPSVAEVVSRILRGIAAGAFNVHQSVTRNAAEDVLITLIMEASSRSVPLLVCLPSGEVVDSEDFVVRPAARVLPTRPVSDNIRLLQA